MTETLWRAGDNIRIAYKPSVAFPAVFRRSRFYRNSATTSSWISVFVATTTPADSHQRRLRWPKVFSGNADGFYRFLGIIISTASVSRRRKRRKHKHRRHIVRAGFVSCDGVYLWNVNVFVAIAGQVFRSSLSGSSAGHVVWTRASCLPVDFAHPRRRRRSFSVTVAPPSDHGYGSRGRSARRLSDRIRYCQRQRAAVRSETSLVTWACRVGERGGIRRRQYETLRPASVTNIPANVNYVRESFVGRFVWNAELRLR